MASDPRWVRLRRRVPRPVRAALLGALGNRLASHSASVSADEAPPRRKLSEPEVGALRLATFRLMLGSLPPGRLLDLGAGHGSFSLIGKELGWDVTAVDARTARMPMTPGIRWVEADVRTFDPAGYDCIAILGLLYHLGLDDQVNLLRRCSGTTTILDTHHSLRPSTQAGGYRGHIYREPGSTAAELAPIATASWGNPESFWATRPELIRLLHDAGYGEVLAQEPPYLPDRSFYLCLASSVPPPGQPGTDAR